MVNIISDVCKYIIIILVVWYTVGAFTALQKRDREELKWIYYRQNALIFLLHGTGYLVIVLNEKSLEMVIFYVAQVIFFSVYLLLYRSIYKKSSMILLNHMMFFLALGFIMLGRLSYEKVTRQFVFACIAAIVTLVVPQMFAKLKAARLWAMIMGIIGLLALAAVLVVGQVEYGAKLSIQLPGGFSLQPSEFVNQFCFIDCGVIPRENRSETCDICHGRGGNPCYCAGVVKGFGCCVDIQYGISVYVICGIKKTIVSGRWVWTRSMCSGGSVFSVFPCTDASRSLVKSLADFFRKRESDWKLIIWNCHRRLDGTGTVSGISQIDTGGGKRLYFFCHIGGDGSNCGTMCHSHLFKLSDYVYYRIH